jgi:ABC-type nitrate/sulfonate/bicarbonate transport system substrate-binding protein|tara:strand:- start:64 stop:279 length:216 start_codon:yes stop_codon:yes gene_type:complete
MSVTIEGWTLSNANAEEIREAIAKVQGEDVADVDAAYVREWMANHVRQAVMDKRRRDKAASNPPDGSDPLG